MWIESFLALLYPELSLSLKYKQNEIANLLFVLKLNWTLFSLYFSTRQIRLCFMKIQWKWKRILSCLKLQVWLLIFLIWILNQSQIHTTIESMNSGLVTISSLLFHFRWIQRFKNMQTVQTSWCLFVGASANSRHLNSHFRRFMLILTFLFTPEICHNHHNRWWFKKK